MAAVAPDASTIADILLAQQSSDARALCFADQCWTYREYVAVCADVANLLLQRRAESGTDQPFHIGVLLDNVPYYPIVLGAAALVGAAIVGMNPTRRGAELERDISHSECQFLITEDCHLGDLEGVSLSVDPSCRFNVDSSEWQNLLAEQKGKAIPKETIDPATPLLLIFTSGTTGNPKAAICSQARLAYIALASSSMNGFTTDEVCYLAMPLFHSNSIMANWAPAMAVGASVVLARKFSASGFLPDIRRYGCTYMNYVGKPLTYILATPEQNDDADNTLRIAFGNEAVVHDIKRFEKRFGCKVYDNYGSTEGGISITRTAETPSTALGIAVAGTVILDPETEQECALAEFDSDGRLLNAEQAIGEIANRRTAVAFEGYWRNEEANSERTHGGIFWSGDLGYRDAQGFIYFGGRNYDWLRVDGENFAAAPIESILTRNENIEMAAVYAVPNSDVGDDVMATVTLAEGVSFDGKQFMQFIDAQSDMGTKWLPRYIRIAEAMPMTASNKIVKRDLRAESWNCLDPVWYCTDKKTYRLLAEEDVRQIEAQFEARGRLSVLQSGA